MARMKAPVGCAGQSAMGQVQFNTRFCSIRVVRYSFQQDWQGREELLRDSRGAAEDTGVLVNHLALIPDNAEGQGRPCSRGTSQRTLTFLASVGFPGIGPNHSCL